MSPELTAKHFVFHVRDCAFTPIATGYLARSLVEFHKLLKVIPAECIYHHFWRQTLDASLAESSYYNDFSHWAHYNLHDDFLAERLTWINPAEYADLERLRFDMLEITTKRIEEQDLRAVSFQVTPFYFVKSQIVVFNTPYHMDTPKELVKILPHLSTSSIFYHFIDARRRQISKEDDFTVWLKGLDDPQFEPLIRHIKEIDPYFTSLYDLQKKLGTAATDFFTRGTLS